MRQRTVIVIVVAVLIVAAIIVAQGLFQRQPASVPPTPPPSPTATTAPTAAPTATEPPAAVAEATAPAAPAETAAETAADSAAAAGAGQAESPLQPESPLGIEGVPWLAPAAVWPAGHLVFHSNAASLLDGPGKLQIYSVVDGVGPVSLTADLPASFEPALSRDGTMIAFAVEASEDNVQIYVMGADGSDPHPISEDQPALNWRPSWSPDGQSVVFNSNRDGRTAIYRASLDGAQMVNLTDVTSSHGYDPDWSPDGEKIVFVSDRDYGIGAIYTMDSNGENVQEIPGPQCPCFLPRWSPDGTMIAFASKHDTTWDIFVMNADGSDVRQVSQRVLDNRMASWVGNDRILFVGDESNGAGTDLFLVNIDGTNETRLTSPINSADSFPSWRP